MLAPRSQAYRPDRNWTRQDNRRIGGDLNNVARLATDYGDFKLDLGGSFQFEDLQPQKSVVTTLHDINAQRTLRDGSRQEYSLNGKLEYKPVERLTLWGGGRYSHFRSKDNGISATARREDRDVRFITVSRPDYYGSMMWFPDRDGQYTDATDPRLHNGIVSENLNSPFEGIPFDEIGEAEVTVSPRSPPMWSPATTMPVSAAAAAAASRRPLGSTSSWHRIPLPTSPIPRACACRRYSRPALAP